MVDVRRQDRPFRAGLSPACGPPPRATFDQGTVLDRAWSNPRDAAARQRADSTVAGDVDIR
jgi:hypothetical protein